MAPADRRSSPVRARIAAKLHESIAAGCIEVTDVDLRRSALVVAPHYDDETLGCGGTIARKSRLGAVVRVVFLTDGAASHGDQVGRDELARTRRLEAGAALRELGLDPADAEFAELPDGDLSSHHDRAVEVVEAQLARWHPEQVFVPHLGDGHADHTATTVATFEAVAVAAPATDVYEYPVWHWQQWPWVGLASPLRRHRWGSSELHGDAWRRSVHGRFGARFAATIDRSVDISESAGAKRAALERYESQVRRPAGRPDWPTLGDVSRGQFLPRLLGDREFLRLTPGVGSDAS